MYWFLALSIDTGTYTHWLLVLRCFANKKSQRNCTPNLLISFEQIIQVNKSLISTLGDSPDVPRVLVGTHRDLQESRQVKYSDAQRLADSWGVPYLECSSKTGENVAEVFHTLLKEIEKDDGLLAEAGEGGCVIL